MAEFLDITPNYLLYGRDKEVNGDTLSASEMRLIRLYRQMGMGKKHTVDWFVNVLNDEKIHKKYNLAVKTGRGFIVEAENTSNNPLS